MIRSLLFYNTLFALTIQCYAAQPDHTLPLWSGKAPGVTRATGPEAKLQNRPRPFYQLTQIAEPSLEIYLPKATEANGTTILVCPGGGMQRLAYEHEGLEVAQWLNTHGIIAGVLKYRVPGPAKSGAIDAQRAMSMLREHAEQWGIDTSAVGFIGFSAGGEIGTWLATHHHTRLYDRVDATDDNAFHPDFVSLIYSGGLLKFRTTELKAEFADNINADMPNVFMAHAFNDGCQNSIALAMALKQAGVPTEFHLFQEGGHGFGVRTTGVPTDAWQERFIEWLDSNAFMDAKGIRSYVKELSNDIGQGDAALPSLTDHLPDASLKDAYRAQTRWVKHQLYPDNIGGFKGAAASKAAQDSLGIDGPLVGILPADGAIQAEDDIVLDLTQTGPLAIETEIGYRIAVDISYEVLTDQQAREAVSAIVPVVELPSRKAFEGSGSPAINMAASNIGSFKYIVGENLAPSTIDTDTWSLTLKQNTNTKHSVKGNTASGGQFHNLRKIMNQLTQNGHTLPAGTLIISGALGGVHPAEPGSYRAQFGTDQVITFEIK